MSEPQFVDGHPEPEWLSAWHDGELAGAAAEAVAAHVEGCAACRARLADYAALDAVGPWLDRNLPNRVEWDGIDERLRARMDEEIAVPGLATQGRRRIEPPGFRLRWALATAAGLAVLVVGSRVLLDRDWGMGGILGPSPSMRAAGEVAAPTVASREATDADRQAPGATTAASEAPRAPAANDAGTPRDVALQERAVDEGQVATATDFAKSEAEATADDAAGGAPTPTPAASPPAAAGTLAFEASSVGADGRARADEDSADSLATPRARIAAGADPALVVSDLVRAFEEARKAARSVAPAELKAAGDRAKRDAAATNSGAGEATSESCRRALLLGRAALTLSAEYRIDISRRLTPEALAEFERCDD